MPWWVEVLDASEQWGVPPWELLEQAPDLWMERRLLWNDARRQRANRNRPPVGEWVQQGKTRSKRLI